MTDTPHAAGDHPDDAATTEPAADAAAEQFEEFIDDAPASAAGSRPVADADELVDADDVVGDDADNGWATDAAGAGWAADVADAGWAADVADKAWAAEVNADDAEVEAADTDPRVAEVTAERDEFKDIAQRVQAEFDNYRKRSASQQAAEVERATGAFAEALLPVLDAAESAYVAHPDEVGPLFNLLLAELRKRGLELMNLLDEPFDPNLADAVAHEPGDGGEPRVAEVLRSGYTWKGKTLRAAMVRTTD